MDTFRPNLSIIPKAPGVPVLNNPTLWYHNAQKTLYQGFGGHLSDFGLDTSSPSLSLWRLQLNDTAAAATNGLYTIVLSEGHSAPARLTQLVGGLLASAGDSAYVLGSFSGGEDGVVLPGLVHYNMSSGDLRNESAAAYHGTGSAQRGQMVHVPAYGGARGVFLS
jgi:hypothetical protein